VPTCYVTTPFGIKTDPATGAVVDHDDVYLNAIRPAAESAGCSVIRGDEDTAGFIQQGILRHAISCDVFIADIGYGNPNVLYEVGVRHAARRGVAILLGPAGSRVPFNISNSRVLLYQVDSSGRLPDEEAYRLRSLLQSAIQQGLADERNDSPVFEFFSGYTVELPEQLRPRETKTRVRAKELKQVLASSEGSDKRKEQAAKAAEEMVKSTTPDDPAAAVEVLKRYRLVGAWDDLIRFADELPPSVSGSAQIQQMVALALNRRNRSGDRDRALGMMTQLVARTGGDGESHGILGRIYKDRFDESGDPADIQQAIAHYRSGFAKEPSDYYPGLNLVTLLFVYGGDAAKQELADVLPRVRAALASRMDPQRAEYWEIATAFELAVIAGDWVQARDSAGVLVEQAAGPWMIETTLASLRRLESVMKEEDIQQLQSVAEELRRAIPSVEVRNA
jgi:hypothetical protein